MTDHKHTIRLTGTGTRGTRISTPLLRQLLDVFVDAVQRSLRLRVEGRSTAGGPAPAWLDRACDIDFLTTRKGSTEIDFAAPLLGDAAPDHFAQLDLFTLIDPKRTAVDVFAECLSDAVAGDVNSDRFDDALVSTFEGFGKLLRFGIDAVTISAWKPVTVTTASVNAIRELRRKIPAPQRSLVAGTLDAIRHSDRMFTLLLGDGSIVRGVVSSAAITPEQLAAHFGKVVLVEGPAHFRPSGAPLRIDAERISGATDSELQLFSHMPRASSGALDGRELTSSQGPRSGVNAIWGEWPGDETDEEFDSAMRELS